MRVTGEKSGIMRSGGRKNHGICSGQFVGSASFCGFEGDLGIERDRLANLRKRDDLVGFIFPQFTHEPFAQLQLDH